MAGLMFTAVPSVTVIATGAGPKTILQIAAPANQRVVVSEILLSFNGVTAADPPVLIELLYQSTAGTASALTPLKVNSSDTEAIQTTAQQTFTVEPTAGNIIWRDYIHTQTGDREIPLYSPKLPGWIIPGGSRLGIRYTSGTVTGTVNCAITAVCEE